MTPKPVIKGKKIAGARIDTWNRGYKPGGGNLKIYNKGVTFEDREEPVIETWDETHTIHQGAIQVHIEPEEPEESTVEVITRPFEVERVSRTVHVTREMKKPPTPPEPVQVRLRSDRYNNISLSLCFIPDYRGNY